MAANKDDIRGWLKRGLKEKCTHVIVVCDTYDYDDYPVFVAPNENVHNQYEHFNGKNMQKVMEVYNLGLPIEPQLSERRAFYF